jgi:hypothetical protein
MCCWEMMLTNGCTVCYEDESCKSGDDGKAIVLTWGRQSRTCEEMPLVLYEKTTLNQKGQSSRPVFTSKETKRLSCCLKSLCA